MPRIAIYVDNAEPIVFDWLGGDHTIEVNIDDQPVLGIDYEGGERLVAGDWGADGETWTELIRIPLTKET